ncbi:dipeptidase [Neomegalonema sp.]|uniref:dipeptidase n=1 Tax=Neomegalonema sp. TaxID=2039713 RepID=UPI002613622E|nr:dipeptidase [Neomegalonema sp.]MDD2869404.1 dipeptidase [Neomegalonema sp.]
MTAPLDAVLARLDSGREAALDRLIALLKIPSISTDPAYAAECVRAADWLVADLRSMGFAAESRPTAGHPIVVAHDDSAPAGAPHVLFYGHYDVQPVDPLELWESPPFEPRLAEGPKGRRIYARGSSDDKGQVMTFLEACRSWKAQGGLPVRVTIVVEGEEESGGEHLPGFLREHAEELRADVALVCDTDMWNAETPSIGLSLRGLVGEELRIRAAARDLHSGMYGGAARNPATALAKIIAGLHDDKGRVTLAGFYDGVPEPSAEIRASREALGFDESAFLGEVGLTTPAGEQGRSVLESIWSRPTCEINGISGGYAGAGFKTVLPAEAMAKISFRLVGDQDPAKIRAAFRAHVQAALPPDCKAEFVEHGGSPGVSLPLESRWVSAAREALGAEWGKPAALVGSGGSIPVVGLLRKTIGVDTLLIGFALNDDSIHAPNEKYELRSFEKGARSWARVLARLAEPAA